MRPKLTPIFYREVEHHKRKLIEYADAHNRTLAQVLRDAVELYLQTISVNQSQSQVKGN